MTRLIAIDTETELLPPSGTDKVQTHVPVPALACMSWSDGRGGGVLQDPDEITEFFWGAVEDVTYVFHNAAFDLAVLSAAVDDYNFQGLVDSYRVLDTRVLYLMRDPDPQTRRISLEYLAQRMLRRDLDKGAVRTSFTPGQELTPAQYSYALEDARTTYDVARSLLALPYGSIREAPTKQILVACETHGGLDPDREYSRAAANQAWHLTPRGLRVDTELLGAIKAELEEELDDLGYALEDAGLAEMVRQPGAVAEDHGPADESRNSQRRWRWSPAWQRMHRVWKKRVQTVPGRRKLRMAPLREAFGELAEELDLSEIPRSAKTGAISLRRDDWKDYEPRMSDSLKTYMQYQKTQKYLSAFVRPLVEAQAETVCANYWIPGAATGRWASSKPNLQQVPKKRMRALYRAHPGHVLVQADYPTLELYTLAQVLASLGIRGPLMEALESGEDIHRRAASLMWGLPAEDVTDHQRQAAKVTNFGLPGGMGVARLQNTGRAAGLSWTWYEAREIRERWLQAFSDVALYLELFKVDPYKRLKPPGLEARDWLYRLGFDPEETWPSSFELMKALPPAFTVRLPSGRVIPDRTFAAAANALFQGSGADVITCAFNRCVDLNLDVRSVVHDSIAVQAHADDSEWVGPLLAEAMGDGLARVCPDVPRPHISYDVSEALL